MYLSCYLNTIKASLHGRQMTGDIEAIALISSSSKHGATPEGGQEAGRVLGCYRFRPLDSLFT